MIPSHTGRFTLPDIEIESLDPVGVSSIDRSRKFLLPGIQDLNKDQDAVLALPLSGQHLIVGGPGTGKSVVVLLRARRLAQERKKYRLLVYNHLLNNSNQYLFNSKQDLISKTWDQWFRDLFKAFFSTDIPTLEPEPNGYRQIDWETVENQFAVLPGKKTLGDKYFLLIDEGQDMPPAFYRTLINWGLENFYVVADQNQQLEPDKCSSRQDIENCLAIETQDTFELKTNYRNTHIIALLAQHFRPDDPASPQPDLPKAKQAMTPELWTYGMSETLKFNEIIDRILKLSDRNPRKLIGIITPNNKVRENYLLALQQANPLLDNGIPPISTYSNSNREREATTLDFGQGGIMVINAHSCKGLEFDVVVLADINQHQPKNDYVLRTRFYVMVTRARERVILLQTGNPCPKIESLLPNDSNILSRK